MHNIIRFLLTPETEVNLEWISMTWSKAIYIHVYRNTNKPVAEKTMRNNILDYAIHLIHWGRDEIDNFTDDIFKYIFLDKNFWILIQISLKFAPKGPIDKK